MEYKEWLESQIKNANETAEKYAKEKEFGTAYMYLAKVTAFEECLAEFEKLREEPEQGVSFSELEVGKKYNFTLKDDDFSEVITIIAKGCDNKGRYVWYSFESSPNVSFRGYESEYAAVKYFKEVG